MGGLWIVFNVTITWYNYEYSAHSFTIYLPSIYYVPGTVLGIGNQCDHQKKVSTLILTNGEKAGHLREEGSGPREGPIQ